MITIIQNNVIVARLVRLIFESFQNLQTKAKIAWSLNRDGLINKEHEADLFCVYDGYL